MQKNIFLLLKNVKNTESAQLCMMIFQNLPQVTRAAAQYPRAEFAKLDAEKLPEPTDASAWSVWKAQMLHHYSAADLNDVAVFLYCATH